MATNSSYNIYCYGLYHGGNNQQWMIMPLYPKSKKVVFINRHDGRVMDRHHSGNLYAYPFFNGGGNQQFRLQKVSNDNYAIICSDIFAAVDRSNSTKHRNPFTYPIQNENNLYCGGVHYGANQQFQFVDKDYLANYSKIYSYKNTAKPVSPPLPMSITDVGEDKKHGYKQRGQTVIPFFLIKDTGTGSSNAWKAKYSPYYILKWYQYYKLEESAGYGSGIGISIETQVMNGITTSHSTEVTKTMEITFSTKGSVGFAKGGLSANIGKNMEKKFGVKIFEKNFTSIEQKETKTLKWTKTEKTAQRVFVYRLVNEYKLYRLNSDSPILEWEVIPDQYATIWTYPGSDVVKDTKKAANGKTDYYVQTPSKNAIPVMSSNVTPYGKASSSSQFSSSYSAWKAFDNSRFSLWVSKKHGSFTPQWIKYYFEKPIVVHSYSITAQIVGLTNRSPKSWKLQGKRYHRPWETLDSRSNYDASYWNSKASRDFNIKYPKKYAEYRLLITYTNGSVVASVANFKLYSREAIHMQKGATINIESQLVEESIPLNIDLKVLPNPTDGNFSIELVKKYSAIATQYGDTSKVYNELVYKYSSQNNEDIIPVTIFNMCGQVVYKGKITDNISNIALKEQKGIYLIEAIINSKRVTKKFIIK